MNKLRKEIKVIRSNRKTIALEIRKDLSIVVRAPYGMSSSQIEKFILEKSEWIDRNLIKMQERIEVASEEKDEALNERFTDVKIKELAIKAREIIPVKTAFFAQKIGVTYGKITIRCQVSRWGSCSAKGNLNFNCLLMSAPEYVLDYVVVHELCHRKQMNHSPKFWAEVEKIMPDYKEARKWLRKEGSMLINQVRR